LTDYNKRVIKQDMKSQELKSARLHKGWTQTQAATRLGMTQAYLNFLENGKRRLTPELVSRAASVYGLPPDALPFPSDFVPKHTGDQRFAELLAKLGYPGFSYLHTRSPRENPAEVLLTALGQDSLDGRVAEALPWVALHYAKADSWLVENARKFNLQNRLGFVVSLAQRLAEKQNNSRLTVLNELEKELNDSRLAKEDAFYRPPRTESEKSWLKQNRTSDAAHWNLLTDMKPEQLQYAT
jgi:transcriptional regulator with XRE-family HTH domain